MSARRQQSVCDTSYLRAIRRGVHTGPCEGTFTYMHRKSFDDCGRYLGCFSCRASAITGNFCIYEFAFCGFPAIDRQGRTMQCNLPRQRTHWDFAPRRIPERCKRSTPVRNTGLIECTQVLYQSSQKQCTKTAKMYRRKELFGYMLAA